MNFIHSHLTPLGRASAVSVLTCMIARRDRHGGRNTGNCIHVQYFNVSIARFSNRGDASEIRGRQDDDKENLSEISFHRQ